MNEIVKDMALEPSQNPDQSMDAQDAAWASINTPLHFDAMMVFLQDVERLFRINPMLEFKKWEKLGASQYFMSVRNISQEIPFDIETMLTVTLLSNGIEIRYDRGIKSHTVIEVEAAELDDGTSGSKLIITDHYDRLDETEREAHLDEVDKSLVVWATDLQKYLVYWQRWSRIGLWRWYMRKVWQPMKPAARRITYMLLWISVVEVALIALGAGIYFAEYY